MEEEANSTKKRKASKSPVNENEQPKPRRSRRARKSITHYETSSDEEDVLFERNRTPSGNVLTGVRDIRPFFSPKQCAGNKGDKVPTNDLHQLNSQLTVSHKISRAELSGTAEIGVSERNCVVHSRVSVKTNTCEHDESDNFKCDNDRSRRVIATEDLSSPEPDLLKAIANNMAENQKDAEDLRRQQNENASHLDKTETKIQDEHSSSEMDCEGAPKSITLEMVWSMFKDLKDEFIKIQNQGGQVQNELKEDCIKEATQAACATVNTTLEIYSTDLNKVNQDLTLYKNKTEILAGVCNGLFTEVNDLTQKVEQLELNNAKRMITISGLQLPEAKKEDNIDNLQYFFEEALGLRVVVEDFYFMGDKKPKIVVVELQNTRDKRIVLKQKYSLKNYRNGGRKVYINDYVPMTTQEKRRREQKIVADIQYELGVTAENEGEIDTGITYTRAGLTINGRPYRKKISPPSPSEMLQLSTEELDYVRVYRNRFQKFFLGKVCINFRIT